MTLDHEIDGTHSDADLPAPVDHGSAPAMDLPQQDEKYPPPPQSPLPATPARRKFWRRKLFYIPAILLSILLLAVGAVYFQLSREAFSAQRLTDQVTQSVQTALPDDVSFEFKDVSVSIDPLRGLVAHITDPRLKDRDSRVSLAADNLSFGLQLTGLARGKIRIRDIEIDQLSVSVSLTSEAQRSLRLLNLSANASGRAELSTPLARVGNGLAQLHQAAQRVIDVAAQRGLGRITILDGSVAVTVQGSEQRAYWNISSTLDIEPATNRLSVRASGIGRGGAWRFEGSAKPVKDGRGNEIKLALNDIILPEIIPAFGRENFSIRSDAPVTLSMRSKYVGDNEVPTAAFKAVIGSSYVNIGSRDVALLDRGIVSLIWSPELNAVSVEEASLKFGDTVLPFAGFVKPSENNPLSELAIRLVAREAVLAPRDVPNMPPLPVELIGINGRFDVPSQYLTLDTIEFRTELSRIIGSANVDFQSRFPSVAGAFSSTAIPSREFKQIWPPTLAGGARRWFIRNVKDGIIDGAEISLAIPEGLVGNRDPEKVFPQGAFEGSLDFSRARVRTFGKLPDLSARSGRVGFDAFGLTISVEQGSAAAPSGKTVDIPSAIFRLPVLGPRNPEAQVTVSMTGDARVMAEISNLDPLGFMRKRGLPPSAISGTAVAEVTSNFKLDQKIDPEDVRTIATVRLTDFSSTAPIQGRMITDGDVVVESNAEGTVVRGKAELDGIDADVDLFLPNGDSSGTRTDIRLVLNDSQRKKLGIDLGDILAGPTPVAVGEVDAQGRRAVSVDLTRAQLSLAALGWSKGAGVRGTLDFLMEETDGGQHLENIRLTGDGFSASGDATISSARGLERLDLRDVSLRRGDKVAVDVSRTAKNSYRISISGEQIDARGLIMVLKKDANSGTGGDKISYVIDGDVSSLAGFGGQFIKNAKFSLRTDGGVPSSLQFSGSQGGNAPVNATIEGGNGSSWLSLNAKNGGSLISFLDITSNVRGGSLTLSASLGRGDLATVGQMVLAKFRVGGSESLEQLARSIPGQNGRAAAAPAVRSFEEASMNFSLRNGRLVMDDAQVRGPAMGVTLNGSVDLKASELRLNGVYVPAYGLNNAFSRIPIVGTIIGGRRDQGLLGVTFRVSGKMSSPLLTVNPISAIAPGIFRRIFEYR